MSNMIESILNGRERWESFVIHNYGTLVCILLIVDGNKYTSVFSCYVGCENDKGKNVEKKDKKQNDSIVLHDLM